MSDFSALDTVVSERAASKGEKKHYIPFTHEEFDLLRKQYGKPTWMPADFKLVLQAIGEKRLSLMTKKRAEELLEIEALTMKVA